MSAQNDGDSERPAHPPLRSSVKPLRIPPRYGTLPAMPYDILWHGASEVLRLALAIALHRSRSRTVVRRTLLPEASRGDQETRQEGRS